MTKRRVVVGGLLCLLLINTILDTGSYQITQLQQENVTLVQQTQELQARIAQEESPTVLAIVRVGVCSPFDRNTSSGVAPVTRVSSISSTPSFRACFMPYFTSLG